MPRAMLCRRAYIYSVRARAQIHVCMRDWRKRMRMNPLRAFYALLSFKVAKPHSTTVNNRNVVIKTIKYIRNGR